MQQRVTFYSIVADTTSCCISDDICVSTSSCSKLITVVKNISLCNITLVWQILLYCAEANHKAPVRIRIGMEVME